MLCWGRNVHPWTDLLETDSALKVERITYMISTCNQSAPCSMVLAHSVPSWAKSAARIEGAIMALGAILVVANGSQCGKQEEGRE